jgi:hypothetical protein
MRGGWSSIDIFGIPLAVSTYGSVTASFDASAMSAGSLTSTTTVSHAVSGEFFWNTDKSGITATNGRPSSESFAPSSQSAPSNAQGNTYVAPSVYLKMEYIGGPTSSFTTSGGIGLNNCQLTQSTTCQAAVSTVNLEVDIPEVDQLQAQCAESVTSTIELASPPMNVC